MIEDRDYMRQPANEGPGFPHWLKWPEWSWTLVAILVNVLCFVIECAVSPNPLSLTPHNSFCDQYLALSLWGIKHGYVWQLITYQFMHAGLFHILCNCLVIYMFGGMVEELLGGRSFILIMLSSGVVGGVFQVLAAVLWPDWFGGSVVGASAGAFGLVAAFATLLPERELFMLLFFIIPVNMRAKNLLLVSALIALGGVFFPNEVGWLVGKNVAHAAHLGGMVAGIVYVRKIIQGRWFPGLARGIRPEPDPPFMPEVTAPTFWRAKSVKPDHELSADELLKTQVDPILDKISAHGLNSLTPREREILERASGKLAKR